jgi:hypothetical protein
MTKTPAAVDVRRRARALAVRRLVQRRNAELRRLARRVEIEPRER